MKIFKYSICIFAMTLVMTSLVQARCLFSCPFRAESSGYIIMPTDDPALIRASFYGYLTQAMSPSMDEWPHSDTWPFEGAGISPPW